MSVIRSVEWWTRTIQKPPSNWDQNNNSSGMQHGQTWCILDIEPSCIHYVYLIDLDFHDHENDNLHEKVVVVDNDSCEM